MKRTGAFLLAGLPLLVAGCVTPTRMYSSDELSVAGRACGLALGDLVQESEEPRLLFVVSPNTSARQRTCVQRWARRRSLHLVIIEGAERVP